MTPTPETDQWEAYCDEWYYHMWRLRRKTERGWHDGFHIHTGDEAKGLCDLLNNLERELTAVTKERDEAREQRDRLLANTLHKILTERDFPEWLDENDIKTFREALQSLTTNESISNQ